MASVFVARGFNHGKTQPKASGLQPLNYGVWKQAAATLKESDKDA
jgi:hypothetical protein